MSAIIDFLKDNFFIFEIFVSYVPFVILLKPRKFFWLRLIACMSGCVLVSYLLPNIFPGNILDNILNMLLFAFQVCLTVACLKICYKESLLTLILCGISAYATQHIFYRIRMVTMIAMDRFGWHNDWLFALLYCVEFASLLILLYLFLVRKLKKQAEFKVNNVKAVFLSVAVIVIAIVLNNISMVEMLSMGMSALIAFNAYVVFACLVLLINLFNNAYSKAMQHEIEIVQTLWMQDRRQYEASKQNIELLNMKFHDLKYFINNSSLDKTSIQEMSRCLDTYDSSFNTGNKSLDVVLTEKKLLCDSKGIKFFCMADGKLLNGIKVSDIYSLFGNAIDNAIECLADLADEDKKYISILVKRVNNMVRIQFENFTPNQLQIINGFPKTTKSDKENHGFGLKSIYYMVEKHNGVMEISVEDNVFRVSILLPITSQTGDFS